MPAAPGEAQLRIAEARVIRAHRKALIAKRDLDEATERDEDARAELARQITDAAQLQSDEQRDGLRPLLTA